MAEGTTIPSERSKTVVTATILSAGNEVSATLHLLSLVVHKEINRIPSAILVIADGDPAAQTFEVSNKADFEPGKEIEIKLGYEAAEETVFKGIVVKHAIKTRSKNSILVVECRDKAAKMTAACKSKYFRDTTDSDVIEELIETYGLEKDIEATTVQHQQMVQYNSTDWDFMLCRTDASSMLCFTSDGKIKISKPDFTAAPVLTIQYGATVHEMDAEIDARLQYKSIKGSAWNYTDQELLSDVEAEEPSVPDAGNLEAGTLADVIGEDGYVLYHSGKLPEPELQQWINAKMMRQKSVDT